MDTGRLSRRLADVAPGEAGPSDVALQSTSRDHAAGLLHPGRRAAASRRLFLTAAPSPKRPRDAARAHATFWCFAAVRERLLSFAGTAPAERLQRSVRSRRRCCFNATRQPSP